MIEAGTPQHFLLIRRPLPPPGTPTGDSDCATTGQNTTQTAPVHRGQDTNATATTPTSGTKANIPDGTSFVYCHVPTDSPISPTLPHLVLMAGRRWPIEETIATGKGPLGWDHNQYRTWTSHQHHTALCAMAMLKTATIRAHLENTAPSPSKTDTPPAEGIPAHQTDSPRSSPSSPDTNDDVMIPLGDSLIPILPDQPHPPDIGHIRLTLNETLRILSIANAGLSQARMAFHLHWSTWRRRHQAIARWHHYRTRLAAQTAPT